MSNPPLMMPDCSIADAARGARSAADRVEGKRNASPDTPPSSTGCLIKTDGTCWPSDDDDDAGLQRRSLKASIASPVQQYERRGAAAHPLLGNHPPPPPPHLDHGERVVDVEEGGRQGVTGTRES